MKSLLNFCFSRPDRPVLMITLLATIGEDCGSWYAGEDIEEEGKKGPLRRDLTHIVLESIEYIESHGFIEAGREIKRLFERERYEEVIEAIFDETDALLRVEMEEHWKDAFHAWENGRGRPRHDVQKIMINIEINDRYIMDTIRCKNCGVADHAPAAAG